MKTWPPTVATRSARGQWLVLGASGFVGSALVEHLKVGGEHVKGLRAPRVVCDPTLDAVALVEAATNCAATSSLRKALSDTDRVVIAAGLARPDASWSPELLGANSLLPAIVALAAQEAGVRRVVHISSAAVQGRTRVLTEAPDVAPFSAYSRSKALGEQVLQCLPDRAGTEIVAIRATSVQGPTRATTANLKRIARSRVASVAGRGSQPSAVSSIEGLCEFITTVASWPGPVPGIVLQPWEGLSVTDVLVAAGGRAPTRLPSGLCSAIVGTGYALSALAGDRWAGQIRRIEAMWFGQEVRAEWARQHDLKIRPHLAALFEGRPR